MKRTAQKIRACATWLKYCLDVGYKKEQLNALEKLWWDYQEPNSIPGAGLTQSALPPRKSSG